MAYKPNNGIRHDMMLLDNQLPYGVVEAVLNLRVVPFDLKKFIALWKDSLQDRKLVMEEVPAVELVEDDESRQHLLGLLRFYILGTSSSDMLRTQTDLSIQGSDNRV